MHDAPGEGHYANVCAHNNMASASDSRQPPPDEEFEAAVGALRLLADPTRLRLMWLLTEGEHDVSTLVELSGAPRASVSQHLAKLRLAGMALVRRDGRRMIYRARDNHVRGLIAEVLGHAYHLLHDPPER